MKLSSVDLGNPIYEKSGPAVKLIRRGIFEFIEDGHGNDIQCLIDYSFYSDDVNRVASLKITTFQPYACAKVDILASVEEIIQLKEGPSAIECTPEFVRKRVVYNRVIEMQTLQIKEGTFKGYYQSTYFIDVCDPYAWGECAATADEAEQLCEAVVDKAFGRTAHRLPNYEG